MIAAASRRQVLKGVGLASALPASALTSMAQAAAPLSIHRAVYDSRFPAACAFAAEAALKGWPTRAIQGDVTDLWYHDLALKWRQGPAPIAGVTAVNSLFCLERLAWDAGLRVVSRTELPQDQLVSWLIAPVRRG